MITKKDLIIAVLCTFCLTSALFMVLSTKSSSGIGEYDPWIDPNDDGAINYLDGILLGAIWGTSGTPINKTALLLELQSRIANLETRVPKKGYIFISPAAFTPESSSSTYGKNYIQLHGQGSFYAYLQVPDGVTLKNMTAYLVDFVTDGNVFVKLHGINSTTGHSLGSIGWGMAFVGTTLAQTPGDIVLHNDTIVDATIDNRNCIYTLETHFYYDTALLQMKGIRIEYEYQS
jgi:hypothetical protein